MGNNSYVTLDTLKGTGALNIAGTAYDTRLLSLIENVSRQVDRECNRFFFFEIGTRFFDGDGGTELFIPDLIAIDTLKEDTNNDGTLETSLAAADYILEPYNARPTNQNGRPYTRIRVSPKTGGTQDVFQKDIKNYEISGTWGFRQVTKNSTQNGTLADGTTGTLVFDGGTINIEVGQTLLIDSEQLYIKSKSGTSGQVDRAQNGSTGTAHTNSDVMIIQYPGEIAEATFIQTSRLWKRKDSGFADQLGFPETGQLTVFQGPLDKDMINLIAPYKKLPLGIGI